MKTYQFFAIATLLSGMLFTTACGDDFLTGSPTEKQEAGASATEGVILGSSDISSDTTIMKSI